MATPQRVQTFPVEPELFDELFTGLRTHVIIYSNVVPVSNQLIKLVDRNLFNKQNYVHTYIAGSVDRIPKAHYGYVVSLLPYSGELGG